MSTWLGNHALPLLVIIVTVALLALGEYRTAAWGCIGWLVGYGLSWMMNRGRV